MNKLHWYSFAFVRGMTQGSSYTGYPDKSVTLHRIKKAKVDAKMEWDSVLLSTCYLGFMTREDFLNVK